MFYIVYQIKNLINDKIYIGIHKTNNLEDGYMGSGHLIKKAIKKYGLENFEKTYISIFDNPNDMYKLEIEIVNEEFLKGKTYNISKGGNGGWYYVNNNILTEERKKSKEYIDQKKKANQSIPIEKKRMIAKKMGDKFGGLNKLSNDEIEKRIRQIENIDLSKFGWVKKVSEELNVTHTQTRRFIEKYYKGKYYRRKNS